MPPDDKPDDEFVLFGALDRGWEEATLPEEGTTGATVACGRGFIASGVPPSMGVFSSSPDMALTLVYEHLKQAGRKCFQEKHYEQTTTIILNQTVEKNS